MPTGIRGSNPIWWLPDLVGQPLDDTYWFFVLQNYLPYIPATVYEDDALSVAWSNPIQFLANGTLPNNIFFAPDTIYRLEIRQGPTQNDPLIYLVEDYVPGSGGSTPITTVAFPTENQITNPQFSLISFASPLGPITATNPDPIEVAPGWFLNLAGTGTYEVVQVAFSNSQISNPTNAPYALNITLSGSWTSAYLSQRFNQNGVQWAGQYVSESVTARLEGSASDDLLSSSLVDSNNSTVAILLQNVEIDSVLSEYKSVGIVTTPSTNPDIPPAAYIEYRLELPTQIDIYLTSFQLVVGQEPAEYEYEQSTIERQQDQTFHYYRDSILFQPKDSILTGWDFAMNPWQYTSTTPANLANNDYTADQTIFIQQNYVATNTGNNISVGQDSYTNNEGLIVKSVTTANQFAMIQYIDPSSVMGLWGQTNLSSLVKLFAYRQSPGTNMRFKMRLLVNANLPSPLSRTEPIASWTAGSDPTLQSGWTAIVPENDPVFNLANGSNTLTFNQFAMPVATSATMTLAVMIYCIDNASVNDTFTFQRVSLAPNDFAIDCNTLSFDETLRRCQFYWEKNKDIGLLLNQAGSGGEILVQQNPALDGLGSVYVYPTVFSVSYERTKRAIPSIINIYSPDGTNNVVQLYCQSAGATTIGNVNVTFSGVSGNWTQSSNGLNGFSYVPSNNSIALGRGTTSSSIVAQSSAVIGLFYGADARLGK